MTLEVAMRQVNSHLQAQRPTDFFKILIHQFPWDGETWAVILGTRDHPEEYWIWGKIDDNTRQTSYHDRVLLREVSRAKSLKRSSSFAADDGDDDDFIPEDECYETSAKEPTALDSSKRRRTLAGAAGNKEHASKSTEKNANTNMYTPISDDEGHLTLSQLSASRRKAAAGPIENDRSAATPISTQPQRASPKVQKPQPHNLQEAFFDVQVHVNSQVDSDGLPVICTNERLEAYMKGLEAAANKNNAYLFGSMRATIDRELVKAGGLALPDI